MQTTGLAIMHVVGAYPAAPFAIGTPFLLTDIMTNIGGRITYASGVMTLGSGSVYRCQCDVAPGFGSTSNPYMYFALFEDNAQIGVGSVKVGAGTDNVNHPSDSGAAVAFIDARLASKTVSCQPTNMMHSTMIGRATFDCYSLV